MAAIRRLILLLTLLIFAGLLAQVQAQRPLQPTASEVKPLPPMPAQAREPVLPATLTLDRDAASTSMSALPVTLGAGDLLDITVFDTPELGEQTRVDSTGQISFPLVGQITVTGMAPEALEKLIRQKLMDGHFVKNPQVSVFVAEYAGQMAYVNGEVGKPGAYPLLRSHRLMDIIAVAGGLTSRASNLISINRDGSAIQVNLSDKDEIGANPEIKPGDAITVAQSGIVYVLGDVGLPGGFTLDRHARLNVMQALALAQGPRSSASLSKATLIRGNESSRQEISLDLRHLEKSQTADVMLQDGDILYVPSSLIKGMGRRSIETILSTASGAAIYAYRP